MSFMGKLHAARQKVTGQSDESLSARRTRRSSRRRRCKATARGSRGCTMRSKELPAQRRPLAD